jgi:hypothetical protein
MNLIPSTPPLCSFTATRPWSVALFDCCSFVLMVSIASSSERALGEPAFCSVTASDCCTPLASSDVIVTVCLSEPSRATLNARTLVW